ncbi:MAG: hypothetical protein DMG89_17975 [Acidobacteria bacterium]|nr:MAG: hypothetical protein DMG89_17975 [Acidobacteriota bacterium]
MLQKPFVIFHKIAVCSLVCLSVSIPGLSQASTSATSQEDINKQLMDRIHELESEVKELKEKQASPAPVPEPAPAPAIETPRPHVVADRLRLQIFGDVGYQTGNQKGTTNSFRIGSFDMFMTARISEHVSALGELVILPFSDNFVETDLERLELLYRYNEYFNFGVGRFHTSLGYYNTAYHHGEWLQTAIGRPLMFRFDDDGGFLPLQEIGFTTNGKLPSGKLGLSYVAEIGNGRRHVLDAEPAQNRTDNNNAKAFNLAIISHPSWVSGLQLGFNFYHDRITPTDPPNVAQNIMLAHVVYTNSNYEWLSEGMLIRDAEVGGAIFHMPAFYTQFSRRFHSYRPYVRYAWQNANDHDPIYDGTDGTPPIGRQENFAAGLRYELAEYAGVKLQYDRYARRGEPGWNQVATQFAFTF